MPRAKITKSFVDSVPHTDGGQITFCDTELSGFYLMVGKTAKTYKVQKDLRGRSVSHTIGRHGQVTASQARDVAQKKLFMISQGVNPNEDKRDRDIENMTVAQTFENMKRARKKLSPRTISDYNYYSSHYLKDWQSKIITKITRDNIINKHLHIADKHGPVVANRSMTLMQTIINHAIRTYDLNIKNPVSYLSQVKGWFEEKPRSNYIKSQDLPAWWQAVHDLQSDNVRDFLLLLIFTGLRRSEAVSIQWNDIDFEERTLTIQHTKNGDPLSLPLSDFIYDMLEKRYAAQNNNVYVFPARSKTGHMMEPRKGIEEVTRQSGVSLVRLK